jgi:hypothetical protein
MEARIAQPSPWRLAAAQHGVITRAQLLDLGLSPRAIKHRIATRRLHPLTGGIYALGRPELSQAGLWMAAVLACGEGAALSHASAAALWGIRNGRASPIDVSTPGRHTRIAGIRCHRRKPMPETTTVNSIPVTQPLFTLLDLATQLGDRDLEAAVNDADKLRLIDPETAAAALDHLPPYPGVARLRRILTQHTRTDSDLERRFLRLVKKAGLARPEPRRRNRRPHLPPHPHPATPRP